MINWFKKLITYPKYELIKRRDQYLNVHYLATYNNGFFTPLLYLYWSDETKTFVSKEVFEKFFTTYEEAEQAILKRKAYEENNKKIEKQIELERKKIPIFKKVLTVKY